MARSPTISPSQLDAMTCRLAWHLGYRQGYRAKRSSAALELGTGVHEALEHYYSTGGDPSKFFGDWAEKRIAEMSPRWEDEAEEMRKNRELGMAMLAGYVEHYQGNEGFTVIATEKTLSRRLPVPGGKTLSKCSVVVRLDGLVRDDVTGKLFSLEHKTFSRFSASQLELDHQFTAQVWVGQELADQMGLNEQVVGVIYNGLRKQAPGPRVKLDLFERHKLYRNERQIVVFLHRAYWQYREMNRKDMPVFPQPNFMKCGGCDFGQVCAEYQRGGDWKFLLQNDFTKRSY